MAFSCLLHLKNECDGCGLCEDPDARRMGLLGHMERDPFLYDDEHDPFDIDFDDER